jgi:anti-sigma B factor antagonist
VGSVTSSPPCERIPTETCGERSGVRVYIRLVSVIGFEIRTAQLTPGTYVVSVTGEIDAFTSPALQQELEWVLGDGASNAVVDLANVGFIDSTALRVLLRALPGFSQRGGKLVLVSEDRRILRTLEITGLDTKFIVEPKLADAIAQFADGGSAGRTENGVPGRA